MTDAIVALIEAALSSPWGLLGIAVVATVDGFFMDARERGSRPAEASATADRYMADVEHVVASRA